MDIDHLVPLAEARASGASRWNADTRERYGNDLGDSRTLVAITSEMNEAKGDGDPAHRMPVLAHCKYIEQWVAVKLRWHLSADRAEKAALRRIAGGCPNPMITVTLARIGLGGSGGGGGSNCSSAYLAGR